MVAGVGVMIRKFLIDMLALAALAAVFVLVLVVTP